METHALLREATRADDAGAFAILRDTFPEFVTTLAGFTHRQGRAARVSRHSVHYTYVRESGNGLRASAGST